MGDTADNKARSTGGLVTSGGWYVVGGDGGPDDFIPVDGKLFFGVDPGLPGDHSITVMVQTGVDGDIISILNLPERGYDE